VQGIAERALAWVRDGDVIGLGSGRAACAFVEILGARVRAGLRVRGVPTSEATAKLAREVGVPLTTLDDAPELSVAIDGADEFDPQRNLIKGYGAALVREKIVAACARRFVILVGPEKRVDKLGARGKLPVEVIPFGVAPAARRLRALGLAPAVRTQGEGGPPLLSDNGNWILDCGLAPMDDPRALERAIRAIPGVLDTGLFLGMAHTVLVQDGDRVEEIGEGPPAREE
jgi:ribose 5-phosphate isomerase A